MPTHRTLAAAASVALAAGLLLSAPSPTSASPPDQRAAAAGPGTLVYIKNHNVWLANADGSAARAITSDGAARSPYVSPSQSDGGIIAAGHLGTIVRMDQSGRVLNRMDPPPLPSSVNEHPVDGNLIDVAISPDGSLIAYSVTKFMNPPGASPGYRSATGYTAADRLTPAAARGTTFFLAPSWVGNHRTLQGGGFGEQIMIDDLGPAVPVHWFDDEDIVGDDIWTLSTDLGEPELSPDGRYVALVRGYDEDSAIAWYRVNGDAVRGRPSLPTPVCELPGAFVHHPTWSPDGAAVAWTAPDGIRVHRGPADCGAASPLLVPGGSAPDWSPAPLAPPVHTVVTIRNTKRPAISGVARVGRTLRATAGRWTPSSVATTYHWKRNGKAVRGAESRSYRVTRKDRGARITVSVTAARSGSRSVTVTSKPVRVRR